MKILLLLITILLPFSASSKNIPTVNQIDIQSKTLEYYQQDGYAIFLDDVEAKKGELTIFSQKLEIFFNPKKGNKNNTSDINKVIAENKVMIKHKKNVAKGDKATYIPTSNEVILTGKVVFIKDKNVLKGDKLVYNIKTGKAKVSSSTGRIKAQLIPNKGSK